MGEYKVDGWNNFCRVFEAPDNYSKDYCFSGGTNFQMVDWFRPVEGICQPAVTKEIWIENVDSIETVTIDHDELGSKLIEFISKKMYIKPGRTYLILCNFEASFMFTMPF